VTQACSIDGCERVVAARGWCFSHYKRWLRYGDPKAGRTARNEARKFIDRALEFSDKSECLRWPYGGAGNGYGKVHYSGNRNQFAHRVVCELAHGRAPSHRHYAAHSCGNGHLGCVNPHHLSWKTPAENSADQKLHGTVNRGARNGSAKLSSDQVIEIRRLAGSASQTDLASMYGISRTTVGDIQSHRRWAWLPDYVS
jgi:hypothetical protein